MPALRDVGEEVAAVGEEHAGDGVGFEAVVEDDFVEVFDVVVGEVYVSAAVVAVGESFGVVGGVAEGGWFEALRR